MKMKLRLSYQLFNSIVIEKSGPIKNILDIVVAKTDRKTLIYNKLAKNTTLIIKQ